MWALFEACRTNNCKGCLGEAVDGLGRKLLCNCPHHHLPVAVAQEEKVAKLLCFGCRKPYPASEQHLHTHLDMGEIESESGTSGSVGDLRLPEVRPDSDNTPAGRGPSIA